MPVVSGDIITTSTEKLPDANAPSASLEAAAKPTIASLNGGELEVQDHGDNTVEEDPIAVSYSYGAGRQLGWRRYLGFIYTMCALNASSLASNIVKKVSHVSPITVCLYAFLSAIPVVIPFLLYRWKIKKRPLLENVVPLKEHKMVIFLMWVRSTCSILVTFTLIWSIQYITVADSRTIFAASVITVNIFGSLIFHERFGYVTAVVSVIALCGIVVMAKPPIFTGGEEFSVDTLIGVSIALACMLCASVNMLILRFLHVYHGILNFCFYAFGASCVLPFAIGFDKLSIPNRTTEDILIIVGFGILAALTNTCLVLALQVEEAGTVVLIRTTEIIFTFLWQIVLLKVYPDWLSILGAALVLTGVVVVGARKWIESKDEDSFIRKKLKWLLL